MSLYTIHCESWTMTVAVCMTLCSKCLLLFTFRTSAALRQIPAICIDMAIKYWSLSLMHSNKDALRHTLYFDLSFWGTNSTASHVTHTVEDCNVSLQLPTKSTTKPFSEVIPCVGEWKRVTPEWRNTYERYKKHTDTHRHTLRHLWHSMCQLSWLYQ